MGFLTTAIVVGAAAMGAQALDARKQRRNTEREMRQNKTRMRESMALDETREDTGADIKLGADETERDETGRRRRRVSQRRPADSPNIGGLDFPSIGASLFGNDR